MCKPEDFIRDWIGVPHVYNGRDQKGVDCYGLVWLYYRDVLGHILPDWHCPDNSRMWVAKFMEDRIDELLLPVKKPDDHCLIFIRRVKMAHHMGVYYKDHIFHCPENIGVVYQPRSMFERAYRNVVYGVPCGRSAANS